MDYHRISERKLDVNRSDLKFMESGFVCIPEQDDGIEVRRGMSILSIEKCLLGKVAAVARNGKSDCAEFLLLSRLPEQGGYRIVPVHLITHVRDGGVELNLSGEGVEQLPAWHAA